MHAEAQRRLGHALQAIRSIQTYTADAPLAECLADDLTCSAVLRQLGIVQEALRVALLEEPSLRQIWPELDSWLAACARMRAAASLKRRARSSGGRAAQAGKA